MSSLYRVLASLLPLLLLVLAGCDALEPEAERLVVEAFVETEAPLPTLTLRRTAGLHTADPAGLPVTDATVTLTVGTEPIPYTPDPAQPGRYRPQAALVPEAGQALALEVAWQRRQASATSRLPLSVALDSVRLRPASAPVEAVFADSLGLDLREGWLYPVAVDLYWTAPAGTDTTRWVRTRLQPPADFPSAVVDFLLRTDQTQPEDSLAGGDTHAWTGIYAVPVEGPDDPLPPHDLRVDLLRSGTDYARYALSRTDPDRREPLGNVAGGLGILAGISLDTRVLRVE